MIKNLFLKQTSLKFLVVVFILVGLVACGKTTHEPKVGEYGEALVNSVRLTSSELEQMNQAVINKPKDTFDRPSVAIGFLGESNKNPYRFVIVAKGIAPNEGEVNLKWIGGVQSETSNGYQPQIFQSDDKHKYEMNEPVLLIASSDPFSISEQSNGVHYDVHAELMEASNIQFQSVEVQIWQGKGSLYSWTYYLKFLVILMIPIFAIYRLVSR
ncbi:hypothetical protein [Acinetobacter junii]|uniref:hypothetical protein n=1 Tax=Acinetobacter junii TaxID=40215 RepID=UPI00102E43E9|nr:hypothetical protein [Acinetobacter junii]RZG68659.1 hypothetical protein EXE26_07050 [Acinetobacter junii]